jgi:hypothetical protein
MKTGDTGIWRHGLNSQKFNDSMKKWAKELNRTFSKEESKWLKNT